MDTPPLVIEQIDAGAELVEKFDKYLPVSAAFWVKLAEESNWKLFIASDKLDDKRQAYGEIGRLMTGMQNPNLDLFQVKLIRSDDPLARGVQEVYKLHPGGRPIRYSGPILGGQGIDGAYLYPLPSPAASS